MKKILLALLAVALLGAVAVEARPVVKRYVLLDTAPASAPEVQLAHQSHRWPDGETQAQAEPEPEPAVGGALLNRVPTDLRLLRGTLGRYEQKLAQFEAELPRRGAEAQRAVIKERRGLLRRFLASDYNIDILSWQIDDELGTALEPMPDTGNKFNDWMTWFITNIDEIIEAIKKILALFEGMNPPVGSWQVVPLHDGYAVVGVKAADGNHFALVKMNRAA